MYTKLFKPLPVVCCYKGSFVFLGWSIFISVWIIYGLAGSGWSKLSFIQPSILLMIRWVFSLVLTLWSEWQDKRQTRYMAEDENMFCNGGHAQMHIRRPVQPVHPGHPAVLVFFLNFELWPSSR